MMLQARAYSNDDSDDSDDDDFSDDDELQSPIDDVDPFVFFVDTIKGKSLKLPLRSYIIHFLLFCY